MEFGVTDLILTKSWQMRQKCLLVINLFFFYIAAVMENSTEELREGGTDTEIIEEEAELTEEKTHSKLKGTCNTSFKFDVF